MENSNFIYWIIGILGISSVLYTIYLLNTKEEVAFNKRLNQYQIKIIENYIDRLNPREFELFVAKLFRYRGYKADTTPQTNDQGKDVIVYGYKNHEVTYVECKHYKDDILVGREIVQKLMGACSLDGVKKAIIITTSNYTKTAIDCQKKCDWIEFWYKDDLTEIIKNMNEVELMNWFGIVIDGRKIIRA